MFASLCIREAIARVSEGRCPLHEHNLRRNRRTAYCDRLGVSFGVQSHNPEWERDGLGPGPYLSWSEGQMPDFPWHDYVVDYDSEPRPDPHLIHAQPCPPCQRWDKFPEEPGTIDSTLLR